MDRNGLFAEKGRLWKAPSQSLCFFALTATLGTPSGFIGFMFETPMTISSGGVGWGGGMAMAFSTTTDCIRPVLTSP